MEADQAGTTTAIAGAGCCGATVEQNITLTNLTAFPSANLKSYVEFNEIQK